MRLLETDTLSNQDISSALLIGTYTADAARKLVIRAFADQVAGDGEYTIYATIQLAGAGSAYVLLPKTAATAAAGETAIAFPSIAIPVANTDVVKVYLDGLAGDTVTPDTRVEWWEDDTVRPTTADRTLDVAATGEVGLDFDNVKAATAPTTLTNITVPTVSAATLANGAHGGAAATIQLSDPIDADLRQWIGVAPLALDTQRVQVLVAAIANSAITAAAIATDAIDNDALAANAVTEFWSVALPGAYGAGTAGKLVGDALTGMIAQTGDTFLRLGAPVGVSTSADIAAVQSDTNDIQNRLPAALVGGRMDSSVGALAAGVIGAAAFAANAIAAAAVAADAVNEIADQVWDEARVGHVAAGSFGEGVASVQGSVTGSVASVSGAVGSVTGAVGSIAAGGIVAASFGANAIAAAAVAADVGAEIADAVWDEAIAGHLGAGSTGLALNGATAPSAASVADAVWDELIAGHLGAGSTGLALNSAGAAGDPWSTALPGVYGAGTAGKIISDALITMIPQTGDAYSVVTNATYGNAALQAQLVGTTSLQALQPVGCKTAMAYGRANAIAQRTYRTKHFVPYGATNFRLCYANTYLVTGTVAETNTGNAINIKCAIESSGGSIVSATWGGAATKDIAQGKYATSDIVSMTVPVGGYVWVRCCVTVGAGEYYPTAWTTNSDDGEGSFDGDRAAAGVIGAGTVAGVYPTIVLGSPLVDCPSVAILGDSIGQGTRDYSWRSGYPLGGGWFRRALDGVMPYTQFSQSGDRLYWQQDGTKRPITQALLSLYRHTIIACGVNDVYYSYTLENIKTYALALAGIAAACGSVPHLVTLTPITTSTDGWTSAGNQVLTANEANRLAYNAWALTVPAPFASCIDFAAQVQDGDGKWQCPGTVLDSGTATGGSGDPASSNLVDATKAWTNNIYFGNSAIRITGGTGIGQVYPCSTAGGNLATVYYVNPSVFSPVPDVTSTYQIEQTLTTDGTHPGAYGHNLMAAVLQPCTRFPVVHTALPEQVVRIIEKLPSRAYLAGSAAATGETQTDAAAALTAYDPPTYAEMAARTLVAANYATAVAVAALPDAVWDEIMAGHVTAGTFGAVMQNLQPNLTAQDVWTYADRRLTSLARVSRVT